MEKAETAKNKEKNVKTYSMGSLFITIILTLITIIICTFIRNMKSNDIMAELYKLDREIEKLEKDVKILSAEEAELSSPNRFIETAILNGFNSAGNNNDIIYLKIESENN